MFNCCSFVKHFVIFFYTLQKTCKSLKVHKDVVCFQKDSVNFENNSSSMFTTQDVVLYVDPNQD